MNVNQIAADLAAKHNADSHSVRVKSDRLAIVTLEFVNEWASHYEVRDGRVTKID